MRKDDDFHRQQGGRIQIGPRIPILLNRDLELYCLNCGLHKEEVVELALVQFLKDKDLTPVVQLQLEQAIETDYEDPRYMGLKELLELARTTTCGYRGKMTLVRRIDTEYKRLRRECPIDPQLKGDMEATLELLRVEAEKK